uniref:Integrase, catalytic region, zinc finger, CCHC-type, peptidase aspartic, catalytic n=1 Tax=Tanacetum cinerariifolium TaxID=118510 RepID=A0A6L2NQR8_TANCI|nr:integrase, catalytic region, zinc finger, CCHC-type, peptidase aspartic, catalytic [Tanacetum cinerariifolium]
MLSETRDLDIEGSKSWEARHQELFTMQYPYVQKVAESYHLPIADLINVSLDVPPSLQMRSRPLPLKRLLLRPPLPLDIETLDMFNLTSVDIDTLVAFNLSCVPRPPDIQAASSDTRPPMLNGTDFESLKQRIRLYCMGKDHEVYILQSINEGPFKMGRCRDEIAAGFELTNDDRESQLYNEFKHFGQHKGENIHDYYVGFTNLINEMRHIKMTMPKIQLNSKFVNNMLLEWGRFVMTVKLNKGLKESNHDQLYAYLKQHELHANENKILMERLNQHSHDPLALVYNVSLYQYPSSSSVPPQPSYIPPVIYQPQFTNNPQFDTGLWFRMFRGDKTGFKETLLWVLLLQPKRPQNSNYFKEKMLPMQAQENRVDLDIEQMLFLVGRQTHTFNDEVDEGPVQDLAQNEDKIFQADQCDAFDSDVDEAPTAQTMFMANLSSADPVYDEAGPSYYLTHCLRYKIMIIDALCVTSNNTVNASLTAKLARYKELDEVIQVVLWYLDSGCSKHMTEDRSRLKNFVKKFIETFRFGNNHFGAIMGYEDYVIGDSVISKVYYVEGMRHNLFSVRKFCDSNLEVTFHKHSCYVRDVNGVDLIKGNRLEPILLMSGQISLGLVPYPVPTAPYVPPTYKDLEILFQPVFDEYFEPPGVKRSVPPALAAQVLVVSTGTPSSTTIDQDASSTSYSPSSSVVQPPISHQGVAAGPTIKDNPLT